MEYACSVKSETFKLDYKVDLRCTWSIILSEEILSYIFFRVRWNLVSHILGYDTSTEYHLDSLSIWQWLWISVPDVSHESRDVIAILLSNTLQIFHHCWLSRYPKFFVISSLWYAWYIQVRNTLNHTRRFRHTWRLNSHSSLAVWQFCTDHIPWRRGMPGACKVSQHHRYTAPWNLT